MKTILAALLLVSASLFAQVTKQTEMTLEKDQTATGKKVFTTGVTLGPIPFSSLATVPKQVDGTMIVISDGTPGTTCSGGGNGALGVYLNGHWNCSALASSLNNPVFTGTVTTPITNGGVQCLHVDNNGVLSGTGVDCGAGGGGGGGTVSQIGTPTANQTAVFTDTTHIKGQDKNAIDVRDAGVTCDGTTDDGPALNTLFGSISGRQVNFPDTCKISTSVQLVIQGQSGFVLHGMGDRGAVAGVAGPIIYGCSASGSGAVLYINRSAYMTIEGLSIVPKGPSGCSTSTFTGSIQVDSTGNPGVTTHDLVFDHLALTTSAAGGAISGYTGLSITDGGKQNGEMIRVSNSWIHCQNSPSSIGISSTNNTSDNDTVDHNNITSCKYGIQQQGNMRIIGNLFTSNGINSVFGTFGASIYTATCSSGQMNILYNESDSGGPFLNNDNTGVNGCNSGFNIIGNMIGVSDIASGAYVIDVGATTNGTSWNIQGNTFLVTAATNQYIIGTASQSGNFGPLGFLSDQFNFYRTPTLSNTLGVNDPTHPFQSGEKHTFSVPGVIPGGPNSTTAVSYAESSSLSKLWFSNRASSAFAQQSPYLGLRSYTGAANDDWLWQTAAGPTASALIFNHNAGTATTNWFNWDGQINGVTIAALPTPGAPTGVTPTGTAGATTYTYALVAYGQSGNTAGGATRSTTTGNASLSTTNYNLIQFGTGVGLNKMCVYRTSGGATQGKIGCVNAVATDANSQNADTYFIKDTGLVADGSTLPVTNTTGQIVAPGGTLTVGSNLTANNMTTTNLTVNGTCTGCGGGGGSGTVTSVATTAPITGGPFSTTGTIACPTCATSTSPAAGVAHFAGSTQDMTSSAVVDADLSGAVAVAHGGTGSTTAAGALVNLMPSATRVGDVLVCTVYSSGCTTWALVPGNNTGSTAWLQETSAGAGSWTVPSGAGTVAVVGAGSLTSTALMTGGGTQLTQTPSATTTLDSSGNISVAAGGSVGSADTGTPKLTFATNLITANKQITGTIFNASTGFAIPAATTAGHYLRNNNTNFVDSAIQAGDLPSLSGTYLALSGGGTMNGNILFTDNLYDIGAVSSTRPRSGYFSNSVNAPTINATTGFTIGGAAPLGHFLTGTGTNYADNGRLIDDGNTLSYTGSGGLQVPSLSITTPLQIYSSLPASPFTALTGNSGFGVSNDGNFYVSNNGGTPSQLLTAANGFSLLGSGTNTTGALVIGSGASLAPTSGTAGQIAANAFMFASTTLTSSTLPTDGQCLGRSGTTIVGFTCSGGAAGTFQTNAVNLTSSSTINFQNSNATNGLTLTFANPSAGNVKLGVTGTLNNAGLTNSSTTVNGANCALGSACNVITATAGQVAVSGGSGAAITGAADLTYSTHTFSTTASGIFDFSASNATNGFILPSNVSNTASAAGALTYDTTGSNYHGFTGTADSIFLVVPSASLPVNNIVLSSSLSAGKMAVQGTGISSLNLVTASAAAGAANQVAYSAGASKGLSFATLDNTVTHVLHATAGAPAFGAIVAADLPSTLSSGTAITNAALTTPDIGTPSAGTLTNVTGLPIGGIVATGTPSSSTYLRGDGTWSAATGSNGLSGMTAAQVPIAASANTVTSSKVLAGSGSGIVTGPTTSTTGDVASFTGTGGQLADSAVLAANLVTAASNYTSGQFVKAAGANKTTSSAAIVAADLPAALDNSTSINGTSVASGKTLIYSDSTSINGTTIPASSTLVTTPMTDATASSLDTAFNLTLDTGASSFHSPFTASVRGTAQLQVCFQAGPNGQTVVGSAVTCPNINQSPFAKFIVMTNTAAHNDMRLYQNSTVATGTMLEMNNATAAGTGFYFFKANTGVTGSDTGVGSGVLTTSLRGDGLFTGLGVTLGANGGTGGSVVLNGSTSGSATINTSATGVLALPSGTTATNMTLTTPALGTPSALVLTNATGLPAAQVPAVGTVVDTSSPVTVSTTASSEYHFNQHATAATAMTYNLPTAAAGKQFCISNAYNGTAANTGVITIAGSAAGQFIIFTDGTLSATGGNVTSGGAAADAACVVGVDSTHWMLFTQRGTWTKH